MRRLLTPSTALTLAFTAACGALSCGSTVAPPDAAKAGEAKAEASADGGDERAEGTAEADDEERRAEG